MSVKPNARKIVLGLLLAKDGAALEVKYAIAACALFDITENSVRVTLVRLSAEGLIRASGRGAYVIGPQGESLHAAVSEWRAAEQRVCAWHGRYVLVHTGPLSRGDRQAVQRRERALSLYGLRELERGLFVRPDNLVGGAPGLRMRLQQVGLEPEAAVFTGDTLDAERVVRVAGLWDCAALHRDYAQEGARLERWLERRDGLDDDVAARESYLMGAAAIRRVVFDPWLPEPLIDARARARFVETVRRFDAAGKAIWRHVAGGNTRMPIADPVA